MMKASSDNQISKVQKYLEENLVTGVVHLTMDYSKDHAYFVITTIQETLDGFLNKKELPLITTDNGKIASNTYHCIKKQLDKNRSILQEMVKVFYEKNDS